MAIVYKLTNEQAELLTDKCYTNGNYFNPKTDGDGHKIISVEEVEKCDNEEFLWITELPQIEYVPPIII